MLNKRRFLIITYRHKFIFLYLPIPLRLLPYIKYARNIKFLSADVRISKIDIKKIIKVLINHKSFNLIEIISECHKYKLKIKLW